MLLKELQSLALDVRLLDENDNEVELLDNSEYEVTDFKQALEDGGYKRSDREIEDEYRRNNMSVGVMNEEGGVDEEMPVLQEENFDDYDDGNSED